MRRRSRPAAAGLCAALCLAAAPAPAAPEAPEELSAPPGMARGGEGIPADPIRTRLLEVWRGGSASPEARAERTRRAGLALGLRSLEDPARALLLETPEGAASLRRATAAVRLAPSLPRAHLARARALWREERHVGAALASLRRALEAAAGHLEARLWLAAAGERALARAAALGALVFLLVAGGAVAPRALRDLGALLPSLPPPARAALVAAVLLVPAALGEGAAGTGLALAALALAYGPGLRRATAVAAAALLLAALHPLADRAERALRAPSGDVVAHAAWKAERGAAGGAEALRLASAPRGDGLAERARALAAKRAGRLGEADARFAALLEELGDRAGPRLLNNAANVRLARGRPREAAALYERALRAGEPTPVLLFNLSQALGRAVALDGQGRALENAQALDADRLAALQDSFGNLSDAAVADLPVATGAVEARLRAAAGDARGAPPLRRRLAPGRLGGGPRAAGAGLAAALGAGVLLGLLVRRRGRRGEEDLYAGIARLLQGPAATDPALRMSRLAELRRRQARRTRVRLVLSFLLPGAAGVLAGRPLLGLAGALAFGGAAAGALEALRPLPEPGVLGALGPALVGAAAGLCGLAYLAILGLALARGERT